MAAWRKKDGSDTWHNCSNCSNYPTSGYSSSSTKPAGGERCNECMAKEKAGVCR